MANWTRKIVLNPEWEKAKAGEVSIATLSAVIADRLASLKPYPDEDIERNRQDLIEEFRGLADDESADTGDFDSVMAGLYDWGDTSLDGEWNGRKVCWIDTMSRGE